MRRTMKLELKPMRSPSGLSFSSRVEGDGVIPAAIAVAHEARELVDGMRAAIGAEYILPGFWTADEPPIQGTRSHSPGSFPSE